MLRKKNKIINFFYLLSLALLCNNSILLTKWSDNAKSLDALYEQYQKEKNTKTRQINVSVNPQQIISNHDNNITATTAQAVEQTKLMHLKAVLKSFNIAQQTDKIKTLLQSHSLSLFFAACLLYSLYVYNKVRKIHRYLKRKKSWSAWQSKTAIDRKTLIVNLLYEIEKRYLTLSNPIDESMPLSLFFNAIIKEIQTVKEAIAYLQTWELIPLPSYLSPFNTKTIKALKTRYKRLICYKKLILGWIAQHNTNHLLLEKHAT